MFKTKEDERAYHRIYREKNRVKIQAYQKKYAVEYYPKRLRPCVVCKELCAGFRHRGCEFQSARAASNLTSRMNKISRRRRKEGVGLNQ